MQFDNYHSTRLSEHLSLTLVGVLALFFCVFYPISLAIYRIFFHPLARIPGPKLAGATYWYEYYYDVTKQGKYLWKLIELHKEYGPVLRVNPNEVHISDPTFFHEIYHSKAHRTDRDSWYNLEHLGESLAFTKDHDVHAKRRSALNSYFSMQSIRELEPRIVSVVQAMVNRLDQECRTGSVANIYYVFAAFAMDIVSEYAFGKTGSTEMMSKPEYGAEWSILTRKTIRMNPFFRQFPAFVRLMKLLPEKLVMMLDPDTMGFVNWDRKLFKQVQRTLGLEELDEKEVSVIWDLAHSDLPPDDKKPMRLKDESSLLLGAGSETTAQTLTRTAFRILDDPKVLQRLRKELDEAIPDPKEIPPLLRLQNLPYLSAVIEEGVRLALPVMSRSPRIFQTHVLQYGDHVIPPGSAVSQTPFFVQTDPGIFPDPWQFKPERWLDNKGLHKYQVSFSKGRRACLGINLAYVEMWFGLAMMFRRYEMELFETTIEDVVPQHDFFISWQKLDSVGVRVRFLKERS